MSTRASRWRRWLLRIEASQGDAVFRATLVSSRLEPAADVVVDCRGWAARDGLSELRGVRGEMLLRAHARDQPDASRAACCIRASRSTSCPARTACS